MIQKTRAELEVVSKENIEYIIETIKTKLQVVNAAAINPKSFDTENYEDLLDLYDFLAKKDRFTMSEIESIIDELGKLRKRV
ncbi:DUF1128 domain-containing protein [Caldalkalibacillus mannanilyticus]|uniref:DUF1128 domain-containing protein n=1 Tax=Caldalkalibacillus mannanilyticus TaxID=1418 RepID=UPI0004693494|nr:DUF1128 domain-containing protein [Caldalkalibacillus mannanilyticus]